MKIKLIQRICLSIGAAILLCLPSVAHAGGNQTQGNKGEVIAKFTPIKSDEELNNLKPGDTIVKVCRACGAVTLIRVDKPGKGAYDYVAKKCETCGSDDTYIGITTEFIPLKERDKR